MKPIHIFPLILASALQGGALAQNEQFVAAGTLRASDLPSIMHLPTTLAVAGDMDGDEDLDIVYGLSSQQSGISSIRIYQNGVAIPGSPHEAYGDYTLLGDQQVPTSDAIFDLDLVDVEGDGDLDIVYVTSIIQTIGNSSTVGLIRQTAPGVFASPVAIFSSSQTVPVTAEIADMTGDGLPDIVLGTRPAPGSSAFAGGVAILRNLGTGFTPTIAAPAYTGMTTTSIAVADVDGDNDLDVVCGNMSLAGGSRQNAIYRNNGTGVLSGSTVGVPGAALAAPNDKDTSDVLLASFSGGSFPELVVMDNEGNKSVFSNNGTTFTSTAAFSTAISLTGRASGFASDIDLDGDIDLVIGAQNHSAEVFVNTAGTLAQTASRITGTGFASSLVLADMDRDQDPDILFAPHATFGSHEAVQLHINLHRQLDADFEAPLGSLYTIDVYDRPGYGNGYAPTLFFGSTPEIPRVLLAVAPTLGFLGIELASALVVGLPAEPSGKSTITVPLPSDVTLRDTRVFWQWAVAPNTVPTDWGFTNVVPLTFR